VRGAAVVLGGVFPEGGGHEMEGGIVHVPLRNKGTSCASEKWRSVAAAS
jgi:hypothetical protein